MNSTHTLLTRNVTSSSVNLVDKWGNTTLPLIVGTPNAGSSQNINYNLAINETLAIPNRMYWQNLAYANNLIQCLPVTTEDAYVPGQFPIAALDGASATSWQPASNETASILVNMTSIPPSPVSGLYFNWGIRPPKNVVMYMGNMTDGEIIFGNETVITVHGVEPSLPFDGVAAASDQNVTPVVGNSTTVAVAGGAWSGDYVRLVVEGCWEEDGEGATVGEFVLLGS